MIFHAFFSSLKHILDATCTLNNQKAVLLHSGVKADSFVEFSSKVFYLFLFKLSFIQNCKSYSTLNTFK